VLSFKKMVTMSGNPIKGNKHDPIEEQSLFKPTKHSQLLVKKNPLPSNDYTRSQYEIDCEIMYNKMYIELQKSDQNCAFYIGVTGDIKTRTEQHLTIAKHEFISDYKFKECISIMEITKSYGGRKLWEYAYDLEIAAISHFRYSENIQTELKCLNGTHSNKASKKESYTIYLNLYIKRPNSEKLDIKELEEHPTSITPEEYNIEEVRRKHEKNQTKYAKDLAEYLLNNENTFVKLVDMTKMSFYQTILHHLKMYLNEKSYALEIYNIKETIILGIVNAHVGSTTKLNSTDSADNDTMGMESLSLDKESTGDSLTKRVPSENNTS